MIDILLQSRRNQVVLDVAGQSLMFTSVRALGPTERAAKPAAVAVAVADWYHRYLPHA